MGEVRGVIQVKRWCKVVYNVLREILSHIKTYIDILKEIKSVENTLGMDTMFIKMESEIVVSHGYLKLGMP